MKRDYGSSYYHFEINCDLGNVLYSLFNFFLIIGCIFLRETLPKVTIHMKDGAPKMNLNIVYLLTIRAIPHLDINSFKKSISQVRFHKNLSH